MRLSLIGPVAALAAAVILAVAAMLAFFTIGTPVLPWVLSAAAVGLGLLALKAQSMTLDLGDQVQSRQSHIELLQAQLVQQQSAVDVLADGLDVAIFICDPKASILYANRRAMEMFKFEAPTGRSVLAVTLSYDLEQLAIDAARLNQPQTAELSFTFPEDRVGLAKAWTHDIGQRVFLSIYEITDLRRLERIRQDFVANVSHELRTPMTIIRSMAETLADGPEIYDEKGPAYLERIMAEVDRLSMISNDLLILSSAESSLVRKTNCDVAETFRSVVRDLSAKAAEKGLVLSYSGPDAFMIEANGSQMTQVALNLVENALNYTPSGRVKVTLEPSDSSVTVSVEDSGIGIASDQLPRIFERFYRVDKGRSRATGGTGLGLSIVKHIVEAHGGSVRVESVLHKGSAFTVRLPIGNVRHEGDLVP